MRIRTGHGPDDWTPNVPAFGATFAIRGELTVGRTRPAKGRASVCARCQASLDGRASGARYCSHECQNRAKA